MMERDDDVEIPEAKFLQVVAEQTFKFRDAQWADEDDAVGGISCGSAYGFTAVLGPQRLFVTKTENLFPAKFPVEPENPLALTPAGEFPCSIRPASVQFNPTGRYFFVHDAQSLLVHSLPAVVHKKDYSLRNRIQPDGALRQALWVSDDTIATLTEFGVSFWSVNGALQKKLASVLAVGACALASGDLLCCASDGSLSRINTEIWSVSTVSARPERITEGWQGM
jgi:hypothetical protein